MNSHYRFEQLQLKPISILLSTKTIYIWREQRKSVDNATFYGKLYLAARAIAQKVDDRKFKLLKTCSEVVLNFREEYCRRFRWFGAVQFLLAISSLVLVKIGK